eukprot:s339_g6.t1
MAWPTDLSSFGSLAACRQHFGVTAELWTSFIAAAGDPGDDYRLLAALPSNAVAATIEAVVLPAGQPITVVQAAQLGLVYRLAKRKLHVDSGLDLSQWQDPDPWQPPQITTPATIVVDPADQTKGGERKLKLSSVLDQGDETEFTVAPESQKQVWLQIYANAIGDLPSEQEDATTIQVSAIQKKLQMGQPPFADFGVFQPFGRKSHRAQKFRTYVMTAGGYYTRELPGPSCFQQWKASYRVYRTALIMLETISMATAVSYENFIEGLDRTYQGAWHLIVQADELARSEHLLRMRVSMDMEIAQGSKVPHLWSKDNPWECLFRRLIKDAGFWADQVHVPANAWLSHGSKGKPLTPAEAIAAATIQGGSASIKPDTEATKDSHEVPKVSKNARKREAKRKRQEAEEKNNATKGKGKGKGKEKQACFAWNNNNGACGGLPPGSACRGRDWRGAHRRSREFDNESKDHWVVPILTWAGSASGSKREGDQQGDEGKSSSEERPSKKRKQEDSKKEDKKEAEPKALINGRLMTLRAYMTKRRFHFLHLYAGADDPLGEAIRRQAKNRKMKVTVTSCDIESGADLLRKEPYETLLQQAHDSHWDGVHSGFPCTTFSRLRWREAEGYPGPVRSKQHPYGLPGLSERRRAEADEGTLHVSRTVHLEEAILNSRPEDTFRPVATVENPPPSDHPQHLSAWELPELAGLFDRHNFTLAEFTTCRFQSNIPLGKRNYKPQMFGGNLPGLSSLRGVCMCGEGVGHVSIVGKERSSASARYPDELCEAYAILLIGQFERMAKSEFFEQRAKDLASEVAALKKKSTKVEPSRSRTPLARRKHLAKPAEGNEDDERVRKTTPSKAKAEPSKGSAPASGDVKTETKEEKEGSGESDAGTDTMDEDEGTKAAKGEEPQRRSVEWKGGQGKFGMLRESTSKASDPAKLNFVGGMRNPVDTVSGMPAAQNLGLRIFAAWERLTRTNVVAMESAADYGTKECRLSNRVIEQWRAELRKLVGSKGKLKANLKSRWTIRSPIQGDIVDAWTSRVADADLDVGQWIAEGTPLGINLPIPTRGIFPPADQEDEAEALVDAASQLERGGLSNYASIQDNLEDTKVEVQRLEELGFLLKVDRRTVEKEFSQGTISRLAIIVKERPDKSKERRLIIDLRRSGGNSKAKLREKLILPRAVDAVRTLKQMVKLKTEPNAEESKELWTREMVLVDVSDAFPHLAVHQKELEHCLTPGLAENEFYLFRALLFGYKTAPLLWSRMAAWLARFLQACVPFHEGQHQVYLDDSLWVLQGTLNRRNVVLSFILYSMAALGFSVSVQKGERGASVTWYRN